MSQRPNILFIESDQHNPSVIGAYGDPVIRTPNLDALTARGIVFETNYCASPICVPSRASMLTGRHPYQNEVWTNNQYLHSAIPTFAHSLGAAGYKPVQIGRMHFNGPDQLHGFTERFVGDHNPNHLGASEIDHGELKGTQGPDRISLKLSGRGQNAYQVHDEAVTKRTVTFIDEHAASNKPDPFCLAVGMMLPHQPFVSSKEDFDSYEGKIPLPKNPTSFADETHPYIKWWKSHTGLEDVSSEETERCRTAYYGLVTRLDSLLGDIFAALKRHGILENTLIIYTADHGEQIGEKGLWWKQTFYEDSVKVPAIISWPAQLPTGIRINRVTSQLDLNATMLELVGAPPLPSSSGRSLLPVIDNPESDQWQDIAYSEYCTEPGDPSHSNGDQTWLHRMVRKNEWKLNYYHNMPSQLFNLTDDPDEMNDLSASTEHADIVRDMTELVLKDWEPETIEKKIREQTENLAITIPWAENTSPADTIRWDLKPEWDYLDKT